MEHRYQLSAARALHIKRSLAALTLGTLLFQSVPVASAQAAPTLIVNTEAHTTIEAGDGATNIQLRFGTSGNEIQYNIGSSKVEFDTGVDVTGDLQVSGTVSGANVQAATTLTSSGNLVVEGESRFNEDVTFGSGIVFNNIKYLMPLVEGGSGTVLATDGEGNLTWTSNNSDFTVAGDSGTPQVITEGDTLTLDGVNSIETTATATDTVQIDVVDDSIDGTELADDITLDANLSFDADGTETVTFDIQGTGDFQIQDNGTLAFVVDQNGNVGVGTDATPDVKFEVAGIASGEHLHAQNLLTSSGQTIIEANTAHDGASLLVDQNANGTGQLIDSEATTAPVLALDSAAESADAAHIALGYNGAFDTKLYRSAAATLTILGNVNPETDNTYDLGSESKRWKDLFVAGNIETSGVISGATVHAQDRLTSSGTLVVESTTTLHGLVTGDGFHESLEDRVNTLLQAGEGISLTYDDGGNTLTIAADALRNSSGSAVGLSPEYDGAVYYADGSNNVGQLSHAYDSTGGAEENYYKWTSTSSSLQDYNIAVRVRVPNNFAEWDGEAPIQFRYRTNAASADDNKITMTMIDTSGTARSLTGAADLVNTSWTTATITGPEAGGTYTPGEFITLIVQMFARTTNSGEAHAGWIKLNWDVTTP